MALRSWPFVCIFGDTELCGTQYIGECPARECRNGSTKTGTTRSHFAYVTQEIHRKLQQGSTMTLERERNGILDVDTSSELSPPRDFSLLLPIEASTTCER